MTIDEYIISPVPIQNELKRLFESDASIHIFDIGACEAEDSIRYSMLFPNSKIYAFEPLPDNYNKCLKNIEKYKKKNIEVHNLALANKSGSSTFYVSSGRPEGTEDENWDYGNKSSSILPPNTEMNNHSWLKFEEQISVKAAKLSEFHDQKQLDYIDFIHMDVQGAELEVLKGASEIIHKIRCIWLEVESVQLYKDQPIKTDIEEFMHNHGFVKLVDTVGKISGDQLYIQKKFFNIMNPWIVKTRLINKSKHIYRKLCI